MSTQSIVRGLAIAGAALCTFGVWALGNAQRDAAPRATQATSATHASTAARASAAPAQRINLIAAALEPSAAGADPLQVEPRVPRAAGTPCIQTILTDDQIFRISGIDTTPIPATTCPGPYSKIMLVVELTGPRENADPSGNIQLFYTNFGGNDAGTIWTGSTQISDAIPLWRFDRDVTELANYFTRPEGFVFPGSFDNDYLVFDELEARVASVRLVFWRATTATPAQRVADAVFPVERPDVWGNNATFEGTLPRNIIKVYADVYAQVLGIDRRMWSQCMPDEAAAAFPLLHTPFAMGDSHSIFGDPPHGCDGGSYREVEVLIDGTLAGLAPVFPWLPSNMTNALRNTVNLPAPGVQANNFIPFRVDLTPFAGRLNNGLPHTVLLRVLNEPNNEVFVGGQLILYTDHGRAIVPGAVTANTLAAASPTVTNTLVQTDFTPPGRGLMHHLTGTVTTRARRDFHIDGYVDTSRGRIRSTVIQSNRFTDAITWDVTAPEDRTDQYFGSFLQKVRLASNVDRTSRRTLGSTLLSEDKLATSYPLLIDYFQDGEWIQGDEQSGIVADNIQMTVHQARSIRTSQFHRGTARYETRLADIFDATRHFVGGPTPGEIEWNSSRDYLFTDNRGGCYGAGLTTSFGELDTRTRGDGCPGGVSGLRWWSHPDGSPDSMGWAPAP